MANSLDFRVKNGLVVATTATIQSSLNSTSTLTGALTVAGGAGIRGNLYVGGTINGSFSGALIGAASQVQTTAQTANANYYPTFVDTNNATATGELIYTTSSLYINPLAGALYSTQLNSNRSDGIAGSTINISASNIAQYVNIIAKAAVGNYNPLVQANDSLIYFSTGTQGSGNLVIAPWSNTSTGIRISNLGVITIPSLVASANTTTAALVVGGGIGVGGGGFFGGTVTATNFILNGYQVSTSTSGGSGSTSVVIQSTATNASFFPVFVSLNTSTPTALPEFSTSSFSINPGTGGVGVGGDIVIGGNSTVTNSQVILGTTAATSTASGALQVRGGAGIGGSLYAGNIYSNGSQVIPLKIEEFSASASQTTFTVTGGYVVGTVMVFANGIFLNSGDFTASNGTTIVLSEARSLGDIIKVIAGGTSSAVNQSQSFSIAMSVAMSM